MAVTRIKNNQITDATITASKIASQTLVGSLFATDLTLNSNLSIIGNLTITGSSSNINAVNTFISDPFVIFNNGYTGSLTNYTIGMLLNRNLSSLGDYGAVNTAWVWSEADAAFTGIATTDTGSGIVSIYNAGYSNIKIGNLHAVTSINASSINATTISFNDATVTNIFVTNLSTGNAVISGGYISNLANATITTGNAQSWYATDLNSTNGNIATITATTVNASATTSATLNTTNGNITTLGAVDTTTVNLNATTGNISTLGAVDTTTVNLNVTTGNVTTLGAGTTTTTTLNATTGNITNAVSTTLVADNFSSANAVISGGSVNNSPVGNSTPSTAAFTTLTSNGLTTFTDASQSDNASTGAVVVTGGVGIGANLNVAGNVVILGNLLVLGNTTTLNTESLNVEDLNITVAANATSGAEANGAGLTVAGANATFTYLNADDSWNLNKKLNATIVNASAANITNANITTVDAVDTTTVNLNVTTGNITTLTSTTVNAGTANAATLNATTGNITVLDSQTLTTANLNTSNANIVSGQATTLVVTNFSSGNVVVTGGSINNTVIGNITPAAATVTLLLAQGNIVANSGTPATNYTTGAIVVPNGGGVGITGNLWVEGLSTFADNIVAGNTSITSATLFVNATTATTSTTSGALVVTGGAAFGSNINAALGAVFNVSKTANYDFIVRGDNDDTLIWARPSSTYDSVVIGNSATTATLVTGAKLIVNTTDSIMIPVGSTAQRPGSTGGTDTAGMIRFNTSSAQLEFYNGASWTNTGNVFTVIASETFDGDSVTVAFTLSAAATTASVIVSTNGVLQIPSLAYSVSGTTLTFTSAPATGDKIEVRRLTTTATVTSLESPNGFVSVVTSNTFANINAGSGSATNRMSFNTTGNVSVTANVAPSANVSYDLGSPTNWWKNIFVNSTITGGADIAENYTADAVYNPGTVVEFGGEEEVTVSMTEGSTKIAGVITSNPAHVMNGGLKGSSIASVALLGRVPVNVIGSVCKGDMLISAGYGFACACSQPVLGSVIGKALTNFDGEKGSVEVVVGRL